ncbi:hypothetical protein [Streptomyces sp. NPDC051567]|uniref:hypothetical protein n=1 Tax=Streptomyces sp. NPDC051567 TaxID=3365660 RepID=UPI00379CD398
MKLRNTAAATFAAFALVLSFPGSSLAAEGQFHYKFRDGGEVHHATLHDPRNGRCIDLYGTDAENPGFGPHNETDTYVTLYLDSDCEGSEYRLKPHGKPTKDTLKVRSVRFDEPNDKRNDK